MSRVVLLLVSTILWGVGGALVVVPSVDFIATLLNEERLDVVVASVLSALNIGMIVGACSSGVIAEFFGATILFAC